MCDRRAVRAALVWCCSMATAWMPIRAQTVAEYRQRLDSLGREWQRASLNAHTQDSIQVHAIPGDTVRVGHLIALSDSAHVSLARAALLRISPEVDSAYGVSASELARHPIAIRTNPKDTSAIVTGVADSTGMIQLMSSDYPQVKPLAISMRDKIRAVMTQLAPPGFRKWLGGSILTGRMTPDDWTNARVRFVLADSRVSHDCAHGDIGGCLKAFTLVAVENPAFDLYDQTGQQAIIQSHAYLLRQNDAPSFDACVDRHERGACTKLLLSIPADAIPQPLPASVRQSLVQYALLVGGPDAFTRLVQSNGTPREQLEAASRIPADSLVAGWRRMALRGKSGSSALDAETAIASIVWAGLFAGLSLRSSRWR